MGILKVPVGSAVQCVYEWIEKNKRIVIRQTILLETSLEDDDDGSFFFFLFFPSPLETTLCNHDGSVFTVTGYRLGGWSVIPSSML